LTPLPSLFPPDASREKLKSLKTGFGNVSVFRNDEFYTFEPVLNLSCSTEFQFQKMFDFFNVCLKLICLVSLSNGLPQGVSAPKNISKCFVTEVASGEQKPCHLPFTFQNRIFSTCTNFSAPDGKPW
jgi:hypothetical protein